MKSFVIYLFKVFPWIYLVAGVVTIIANPPLNEYHDENAILAIGMIVGVVVSSFLLYGLSYVIEASCHYLDVNSNNKEAEE